MKTIIDWLMGRFFPFMSRRRQPETCPACQGRGWIAWGDKTWECDTCLGEGET